MINLILSKGDRGRNEYAKGWVGRMWCINIVPYWRDKSYIGGDEYIKNGIGIVEIGIRTVRKHRKLITTGIFEFTEGEGVIGG